MNKSIFIAILVVLSIFIWTGAVNAQAIINVTSNHEGSVKSGSKQTIKWESSNFPQNGKININLIRKISDNPASYEFIRHISQNTQNDGIEVWTPLKTDTGNLVIEVVCAQSQDFSNGCLSNSQNKSFTVKRGIVSGIANVFQAVVSFVLN